MLTVDEGREFCNDQCKAALEYATTIVPSLLKNQPKGSYCLQCDLPSRAASKFCSKACALLSVRKPEHLKKKPSGRRLAYIDYEEENIKAERKRAFDESHALNVMRGRTRDKI